MRMETENRPYCLIDILPKQVPAAAPGRYFTVEKYFCSQLKDICRKFAGLLIKLNCYRDLKIGVDGESWIRDFSPEELFQFFERSIISPSPLFILVEPSDALFVFNGDEHFMTLYGPDGDLLELVGQLASSEGLFVWMNQKEK